MKWEYTTFVDDFKPASELTAIGREGWELVAVVPNPFGESRNKRVYFFKRPVPVFADPPPGHDNQAQAAGRPDPPRHSIALLRETLLGLADRLQRDCTWNASQMVGRELERLAGTTVTALEEREKHASWLLGRAHASLSSSWPGLLDDIDAFRKEE